MNCNKCGHNSFTIDFIESGQCIVSQLTERTVFCINILTDSSLNSPGDPALHVAFTCRHCGDRFVKSPNEWLKTAYDRHQTESQNENAPAS